MFAVPAPTPGDTRWFTKDRFGLFIHWGLYSLAARHEWVKNHERMSTAEYQRYFSRFDPDLYDPHSWAEAAADAGMRYFVVTAKHHEGFCLWDTDLTDYKAPNTPAARDLLRPMVDAFRARDMRVGFYYSLLDWHHPEYTVDRLHPMRDNQDEVSQNAGRDMARYRAYVEGQTRELLTRFGTVDILWYDFSFPGDDRLPGKGAPDWEADTLLRTIRGLQPNIIVNDRLGVDQDVKTPEQYQPREWFTVDGRPVVWEACQTFSGSWGYHRDEASWKSVDQLVKMLIDSVSKGGNLLLNVGPTGRGEFDARALDRLSGIGEWMRRHARSIYGCTQAPADIACPEDCRLTFNPETNRVYLHVFSWPFQHIHLDGMAGRVEYAQLLNDASEIRRTENRADAEIDAMRPRHPEGLLTLTVPTRKPDVAVPVIELFLR